MKKNLFRLLTIGLVASPLFFQSCSKDFLEAKPKGTDFEEFYYQDEQEALNGLVAVYDVLGWQSGNYTSKMAAMNIASDDMLAGGGGPQDLPHFQALSNFTVSAAVGPQDELWRAGYAGVARANILLSKLPNTKMDEAKKKRFIAETKFLRAYFYFDLVRMFKNIPLIKSALSEVKDKDNVEQLGPEFVYPFIEEDLLAAIADLPSSVPVATEGGRITKAAGQALLGKVYLYMEKFNESAAVLAEVNGTPGAKSPYGNQLLANYADLWKVSNKHNSESILEINRTSLSAGTWGCISCTEGNLLNIMSAPRDYAVNSGGNAPDYVSGWGFFIVTKELRDFIKDDSRYTATVANVDSLKTAKQVNYANSYQNTGFFLNKYMGRISDESTGGGDKPLNFPQNQYEIRLADTYLLEAEALVRGGGNTQRAQDLLDAVRKRAGMKTKPVSFDVILDERRLELAGEGHRFFDLVRTKKAAAALSFKGFTPNKNEILPIPLLELENTPLQQNKEYGGTK